MEVIETPIHAGLQRMTKLYKILPVIKLLT